MGEIKEIKLKNAIQIINISKAFKSFFMFLPLYYLFSKIHKISPKKVHK